MRYLGYASRMILFHALFVFILISGTIGNAFSIVIWLKGEKSKSSKCAVYLLFLSISDLLIVVLPGFLTYLAETVYISLIDTNATVCEIYLISAYSLQQMSAWLTVVVTIERTLCVVFPFKFARVFESYPRRTYVVVCVIAVLSILPNMTHINAHDILQMEFNNTTVFSCYVEDTETFEIIATKALISYTFLTSMVPLVLTVLCNVILITKLTSARFQTDIHRDRSKNITKLVIAIGVLFTISTLPWGVYLMAELSWIDVDLQTVYVLGCVGMVPAYLNNALNPWMYCIFVQGFRKDTTDLINRIKLQCIRCKMPDETNRHTSDQTKRHKGKQTVTTIS